MENQADVDFAVKSARNAYKNVWSKMPPKERSKYIYRIARVLQERGREFAVIESMDGGKPIRESRDIDIPLAVAHFFYYAGWADKLEYAFPGRKAKELGVAGQIIPWNFPLLMAAWKIAPALACGNTVVLKPAETTPLTAMKLAELLQDIDLPPGVVNIITGAGDTGIKIVSTDCPYGPREILLNGKIGSLSKTNNSLELCNLSYPESIFKFFFKTALLANSSHLSFSDMPS